MTSPPGLSADERTAFERDGFVTLQGLVPAAEIEAMRERLWRRLERNGAVRDDPSTWTPGWANHLQSIRKTDGDPNANPRLTGALDDLFGPAQWRTQPHWGQALVTFPTPGPWTVPHRPWHLDYPYTFPTDRIWGTNVFLFVGDVLPRGGGTVVVRGSHRAVERFVTSGRRLDLPMKTLRRAFMASHPWWRALADPSDVDDRVERFCEQDTDVDGVALRVVELTGTAGDAVICHPWMVHNTAPNALDTPRMMRATRAYGIDYLRSVGVIRGENDAADAVRLARSGGTA